MRIAFTMKLNNGFEEEYKKRHDALWPELKTLLKKTGINNYSIFLDKQTNILFAYLSIDDVSKLDDLPTEAIMKKWWSYMKDIMETNEDGSPKSYFVERSFLPGIKIDFRPHQAKPPPHRHASFPPPPPPTNNL